MSDWTIEIFNYQFTSKKIAEKFSSYFPTRSISFFERIIRSLDSKYSKLYLLFVDGDLSGAVFAYRVCGYDYEVWSPSYLYVEKKHRNISLLFIINVLKKMSTNIIDVSPNEDVKKILHAIKYKQMCNGSLIIPVLQGVLIKPLFHKIFTCSSPFERFDNRLDLIWLTLNSDGIKYYFCIKKTSRYGIPFFVLVYFDKNKIEIYLINIIKYLANLNPLSFLILPNIEIKTNILNYKSSIFHSFSNISLLGNVYSLLGSEVTEVI